MASVGLDRRTGRVLTGWEHVVQSIEVILSTQVGERVMRRVFGSAVPRLLGETMVPPTVLRFFTAVIVAIELWEPRFRVIQIEIVEALNEAEALRLGRLRLAIVGEYRPRAHLGDPTPEAVRTLSLSAGEAGVVLGGVW